MYKQQKVNKPKFGWIMDHKKKNKVLSFKEGKLNKAPHKSLLTNGGRVEENTIG